MSSQVIIATVQGVRTDYSVLGRHLALHDQGYGPASDSQDRALASSSVCRRTLPSAACSGGDRILPPAFVQLLSMNSFCHARC